MTIGQFHISCPKFADNPLAELALAQSTDHSDYTWASPISGTSAGACGNCHLTILPQWADNAHGKAISNPRFFSLYDGTDISGTVVVSPGYRLDFPNTAGNCANCHAPGAGVNGHLTTVMGDVRDVITAGIHCDYCHKVGGVYLDPATGSVYPNTPGVQGQRVLRPPPGDNIFFGPFDDIPDPDTYLPLYDQSQYCATCHQFSFWGTPIYESYNEWLASPYPDEDVTCQDCHMSPSGDAYFALPEVGGLVHPPEKIPSHLQPGAADEELLQETVVMTLTVEQLVDRAVAMVQIANTGAGHHVPTDHPGRHLILVMKAIDEQGQPLVQLSGSRVPDWGGDLGGMPGTALVKVLQDVASGRIPVVSYWKQTLIVSDNRLPARETDSSSYSFTLPPGAREITVTAQLLFRRIFQETADEKGWNVPDVLMEESEAKLALQPYYTAYLPFVANPADGE